MLPGSLELVHGAVLQGRHHLHVRGKVVQLQAAACQLDEGLQDLGPVQVAPLLGYAPHEEQRHLCHVGRLYVWSEWAGTYTYYIIIYGIVAVKKVQYKRI